MLAALTGDQWIAIAAILVGGIVALAGTVIAAWSQRVNARRDRLEARRAETYHRMLKGLFQVRDYAQHYATFPEAASPQGLLPDNVVLDLGARVELFGSGEVRETYRALVGRIPRYWWDAEMAPKRSERKDGADSDEAIRDRLALTARVEEIDKLLSAVVEAARRDLGTA